MNYTTDIFFVNRKRKLKSIKESKMLITTFTFKIPHLFNISENATPSLKNLPLT